MEALKQMLSPMVFSDQRMLARSLSRNQLQLMQKIREAKIRILEGSLCPEKASFVRPEVLASWQRSYRYGLKLFDYNYAPQLAEAEFDKLVSEKDILLKAAAPYIRELENMLIKSKSIILLTDEQGVMLRIVDGNTGFLAEQNRRFRLELGSVWSERTVGTCGHTLCIELKRPIQICGPEHYSESYGEISCSAAPIFEPDQHHLAGTLCLVTPSFRDQSPHTLALVCNMASAIQHEFHCRLTNVLVRAAFDTIEEAVITVNHKGMIVSANAKAMADFNLFGKDIRKMHIETLLGRNAALQSLLTSPQAVYDIDLVIDLDKQKAILTALKPVRNDSGVNLGSVLLFRMESKARSREARKRGSKKNAFDRIIGSSPQLRKAVEMAKTFAVLEEPVLIQGESGTGKEIFARAIHEASRPKGPLIAVNCAAIPRTLIESELFGYKGGSFTGAERHGRPGKIELADGGTLFLDEIGDMPLEVQPVLLRVLEEKQVYRIGASEPIPVDFRLIAATNKNLEELVRQGKFREDLYFRLAVFKLDIAPLRERKSDISDLLNYFMQEFAREQKMEVPAISSAVKCLLYQYDWPGNVRQLKNTVKYAMAMCKKGVIKLEDLPDTILQAAKLPPGGEGSEAFQGRLPGEEPQQLDEVEKEAIRNALVAKGYNITQTAKSLGLSRSTLYRKIKEYGIQLK